MTDEMDARVRALEAERARPDPGEGVPVEELLTRVIGTLAALCADHDRIAYGRSCPQIE